MRSDSARERLIEHAVSEVRGLLRAADPKGQVRLAWDAEETQRRLDDIDSPQVAGTYLAELADNLTNSGCPPELSKLDCTTRRWDTQIVNLHHGRVFNGPTEAVINLINPAKRVAYGF